MAHTAQVLTPRPELRLVQGSDRSLPAETRARSVRPEGSLRDLRLTRRGWWVLSLVAVGLVAVGMFLGDRAFASSPAEPVAVADHFVAPGESLWQIAGAVALPGEDRRDVVDMLVELNGRSTASLEVGERLLVPVR